MDSMNLVSVWLQCGNAQYALKSGSIMDTTIMIIFSMLLKMEHRSSLEAGREMFYNEFISAVTAFTMLKMEYKHNRRKQNEQANNHYT